MALTATVVRYSTVTATLTPVAVSQTINMGGTGGSGALDSTGTVLDAIADLIIQGHVILLQMVPTGPVALVSYDMEIVGAGEVKKT
jgi:hypothetical protein